MLVAQDALTATSLRPATSGRPTALGRRWGTCAVRCSRERTSTGSTRRPVRQESASSDSKTMAVSYFLVHVPSSACHENGDMFTLSKKAITRNLNETKTHSGILQKSQSLLSQVQKLPWLLSSCSLILFWRISVEYRGCADPENLPLDVDSSLQCKYQGAGKPLWYFCDGHNCNSGQIGQDEAHCGQSSSLPVYANQVLAGSSEESSSEGSPDHGALVAHSPDALPPEQTGEEPSTQGYPYYSEYEYYGEYTETGDTGVAEETEDSDSDNRQHPKFGYYHPKSQSYKSGHETASKSYTGNSDQAFSKSQVGNSNAAFNHDVARLQFDENFQQ